MFIYNVTLNVDESIHNEWVRWMSSEHIPEVMLTGCFASSEMMKVLEVEDDGHTYCIQYRFREMKDMARYRQQFGPGLQQKTKDRFGDKVHAFRTLLEVL